MSEIVNNLDIAIRLALSIEGAEGVSLKVFEDALEEIERLRVENKRLRRK